MRLATIRLPDGTRAVRIEADHAVDLPFEDVGRLLREADWHTAALSAASPRRALDDLDYAPVVPRPDKIVCVGLNYRKHILEMGRELPGHPTLFAKYSPALIGAYDDIELPAVSTAMDWEAELGVVVGRTLRRADRAEAASAIAGYTVVNDVTARDWQYRTAQWLQGKTFEGTTPVGPWLTVAEDAKGALSAPLACEVDGDLVQSADTADLVFDPAELLAYISQIVTLFPGDLIATGTPGGVGHARKPPRYLTDGAVLVTRIDGLGECRNRCVAEKSPAGRP
jgi:acylpyruvate hydrolase